MTQREREDNLRVFMALDHDKRLRILSYLADHGESSFDDLQKSLDMSQSYLGHHLKVLMNALLVDASWDRPSLYSLTEKTVKMMEKYSHMEVEE